MLYFRVLFSGCIKLSLPVLCSCCMLVVKKLNRKKNDVLYFPRVERALVFCVIFFHAWNALWHYWVIFFGAWNALKRYCVIYLCMWNLLWLYRVIFYACGTRSGVIVLYFPRVERTLALLCYIVLRVECALALLCHIFRALNALWYFVLNSFLLQCTYLVIPYLF